MIRYSTQHNNYNDKICTRERHPTPRPYGLAMGCRSRVIQRKMTVIYRECTVPIHTSHYTDGPSISIFFRFRINIHKSRFIIQNDPWDFVRPLDSSGNNHFRVIHCVYCASWLSLSSKLGMRLFVSGEWHWRSKIKGTWWWMREPYVWGSLHESFLPRGFCGSCIQADGMNHYYQFWIAPLPF